MPTLRGSPPRVLSNQTGRDYHRGLCTKDKPPFSQLCLRSASIGFEDKQQLGPRLGVHVQGPGDSGTKAELDGLGTFPECEGNGALGLFKTLPLRRAGRSSPSHRFGGEGRGPVFSSDPVDFDPFPFLSLRLGISCLFPIKLPGSEISVTLSLFFLGLRSLAPPSPFSLPEPRLFIPFQAWPLQPWVKRSALFFLSGPHRPPPPFPDPPSPPPPRPEALWEETRCGARAARGEARSAGPGERSQWGARTAARAAGGRGRGAISVGAERWSLSAAELIGAARRLRGAGRRAGRSEEA